MEQYQEEIQALLKYLPYFEDRSREMAILVSKDKITYIQYEEKFEKFIHEVYQSKLLLHNYYEYLAFYEKYQGDYIELIKIADFETLRAILTGYIEQEKHHEGLWKKAYEEGVFLNLLYAFKKCISL